MPDISCLIVTYNNESTISSCIQSLIKDLNSHTSEIIIIDNQSEDATVSAIKVILKDNPEKIRLIENLFNFGFARAVNQGLTISKGKYVLILNPDTVIHEGFFQTMVSFLDDKPDIGIAAPQHLNKAGEIIPSCREFPDHLSLLFRLLGFDIVFSGNRVFDGWKMGYFDHNESRVVDQPMGAALMMRKKDIDSVGYMDEQFRMFFNDVDLCRRFFEHGMNAYFLSDAKITHIVGHSVKQKAVRMILSSHWSYVRYLRKYFRQWYWFVPNLLASVALVSTACVRIVLVLFRKK